VADLTDARALSRVLGPVKSVTCSPLGLLGHSGSTHERVGVTLKDSTGVSLIVKRTLLSQDWAAVCTSDRIGRQAQLLQTPALDEVWQVFANPYIACAAESDHVGVLMDDLSDHIWADRLEVPDPPPISASDEDALLLALARLHARYWQSDALGESWLLEPAGRFAMLGPLGRWTQHYPEWLVQQVPRGWKATLTRVTEAVRTLLTTPPEVLGERCASLPQTLLHGDPKVSNFAVLADGRVAAIDWAWIGSGPSTLDLGWYLAINGGRLACSKEAVIARYRQLLEVELRAHLEDNVWMRMLAVGIVCGAITLLWLKTLAVEEAASPQSQADWQWWVDALVRMC
jgi:hypothetical protein